MPVQIYYTPTSCGAATYIAAEIGGLIASGKVVPHKVDIGPSKKITATGADFRAVNPKGNVPALVTEKGTLLNEGAATLQYIADLAPGSGLAPAAGTDERYVLINNLNFLASELHASFGPLFGPGSDDAKAAQREKVGAKLKLAEELVAAGTIPSGAVPDVAGLYLYIIQSWSGYVGVSLEAFPLLRAFAEKVRAHPAVSAAHAAMNSAA